MALNVRLPFLVRLFIFIGFALACFYLFGVTAIVALNISKTPLWFILFGIFLYVQLWMLVSELAFNAAASLYGFKPRSPIWLPRRFQSRRKLKPSRTQTILSAFLSYIITVYGFAVAYVAISRLFPNSFNVGELSLIASIYFSVTTMATVGFGDIVPVTTISRMAVVFEIIAGLAYAVFFFSIIASFVREESGSKRI